MNENSEKKEKRSHKIGPKRTNYIYKIENDINHKLYIGKHSWNGEGVDPNYFGSAKSKHWNDAIKKYGKDHFHLSVVEFCDFEDLPDRERYYISLYDATDPNKGYNISKGGNGGDLISGLKYQDPEKYKDLVKAVSVRTSGENNPYYGKKHSKEIRNKISESRLGDKNWTTGSKWVNNGTISRRILLSELEEFLVNNPDFKIGRLDFSDSTRAKMAKAGLGRVPGNKGTHLSRELKDKISKSLSKPRSKYLWLRPDGITIVRSFPNKTAKYHPDWINLGLYNNK